MKELKFQKRQKRLKTAEQCAFKETPIIRKLRAMMESATGVQLSDVIFEVDKTLAVYGKYGVALNGKKILFSSEDAAHCPELVAHELAHIVQ